jgi:two-component system, NarL family, nitrate/nitrite response regulator NarL
MDTPGIEGLTEEERRVLVLVVHARHSREIAAELEISHDMVRTHMQSMLAKLGVQSRLEAVSVAVGHGLHNER